jgi:hypothetical protein
MRWFIVWQSLARHRKFIRLTPELRGAWLTLALWAASGEPRGTLEDRGTVEELLRRDGFTDPAAMLDGLIGVGLLEDAGDRIALHDWWGWERYPSDLPDATRERKRRSRTNRSDVTTGHDSHESVTPTESTERTDRKNTRSRANGYDSLIVEDAGEPVKNSYYSLIVGDSK